jgi:hypothetical protein
MSTRFVAQKLLVKPSATVWSSDAARLDLVGPLPEGARRVERLEESTVAVVFADHADSLRAILASHEDGLAEPTAFWVAYPKANRTDINRDTLWPILAEYGMRPIGQVAIDETWSALRFRPLGHDEAPFTGTQ